MNIGAYLPFWHKLTPAQRRLLEECATLQHFQKGAVIHQGETDCVGLLLPTQGQLRVYILSEEGKELTLYRLFERDMCLLSASCILHSIQFDVMVEAQEDTTLFHIPADVYQQLMESSVPVSNYTNELMASRFSEVMWLMDQIMNKKLDARLAALLLEESSLAETNTLTITHEQIAGHLGSAREVITRMLKYFQSEGLVDLGRGKVFVRNSARLRQIAVGSLR